MATEQAVRPVPRTIIGTAEGINNALDTAERQGRLVSVTAPRPHSIGRYAVTAVLLERAAEPAVQPRSRFRPTRRAYARGAALLGALVVLAVVLVVVVAALRWVAGHAAVLAGALVVIVGLLAALRRRTGVCMGLHCPGCGHR